MRPSALSVAASAGPELQPRWFHRLVTGHRSRARAGRPGWAWHLPAGLHRRLGALRLLSVEVPRGALLRGQGLVFLLSMPLG